MRFKQLDIEGVWRCDLEPIIDERGYFARTWCADEFNELGLVSDFAQASVSQNASKATLRGMHLQLAPYGETKLIRCSRGAVYDVLLDLRPNSATYLDWIGVELVGGGVGSLYVPPGVAHGFQTLVDDTEVTYMITPSFTPGYGTGVRWNDPVFGIEWPEASHRTISTKDQSWDDYDPATGIGQII